MCKAHEHAIQLTFQHLIAANRFKQRQLQMQLVVDRECYAPWSTVHGTVVLACRERIYIKCLIIAVRHAEGGGTH